MTSHRAIRIFGAAAILTVTAIAAQTLGVPVLLSSSVMAQQAVPEIPFELIPDPVWSKYWSEASISSIENLIALITVPVPHRRPG